MLRLAGESDQRRWVARLVCGVVLALAALAAPPASAQVITDAYLQPSESGPPGAILADTRIVVRATGGTPRAVTYSFTDSTPSSNCRALSSSSGAYQTGQFDLTLPRPGGTRTLYVRVWSSQNCSSAIGVREITVNVNVPGPNPPLLPRCGLDVVLVLDESASIVSPGGGLGSQVTNVRNAAKAFVGALFGTGSRLATVAFARQGRVGVPYDFVTEGSQSRFLNWIDGQAYSSPTHNSAGYAPAVSTPFLGTNWQDAFEMVKVLNRSRVANLVVFVTDGDPNWINGRSSSFSPDGHVEAMRPAWTAANEVKLQRSRVFAIGVGPAVTNTESAARLTAISGDTGFVLPAALRRRLRQTDDFTRADYTLVSQFDQLGAKLESIVRELCSPSVTVTKWVSPTGEPSTFVNGGPGWQFGATLTVEPGDHEWVEPRVDPANASSVATQTDEDGRTAFKWQTVDGDARSLLGVQETVKPDYTFVRSTCRIVRDTGAPVDLAGETGIPALELGADDFATCSVFNRGPSGTLTVTKRLIPSTDGGRFDLLVNGREKAQQVGDGGTTGPITVPAGEHFVSEEISDALVPEFSLDQYAINTSCVSGAAVVASGTGPGLVTVPVGAGQDVACTITNQRIEPEPEPEPEQTPSPSPEPSPSPSPAPTPSPSPSPTPVPQPQIPPPPCSDFVQPPTTCVGTDPPPVVPRTVLALRKRAPARARVGQRVPVTITLRNAGRHSAVGITLQETPPGAARIVRYAARNATRHRGGGITWRLGNLAPGQRRTVRVWMRVTAPGSLRNLALASARNAEVAAAAATVRATRPSAPRRAPAVTG